jgi:hypothetical protein
MASRRSWSSPAWRHAFFSRRLEERARPWQPQEAPDFLSASTTTRNSTRRLTCNISRGSAAHGSASTGAMTADWSQERRRASGRTSRTTIAQDRSFIGQRAEHQHGGFLPTSADCRFLPIRNFEAGFTCNGVSCNPDVTLALQLPCIGVQSPLIKVPAPNSENDDHNPPRIASRSLFDLVPGPGQLVPRRQVQMERATDRHQPGEQLRALQLPLHLQRHTLRNAADPNRGTWVPLLDAGRWRG